MHVLAKHHYKSVIFFKQHCHLSKHLYRLSQIILINIQKHATKLHKNIIVTIVDHISKRLKRLKIVLIKITKDLNHGVRLVFTDIHVIT